jgi:hypothetical protein
VVEVIGGECRRLDTIFGCCWMRKCDDCVRINIYSPGDELLTRRSHNSLKNAVSARGGSRE